MGLFSGRDRRQVAIGVMADGRRVQFPLEQFPLETGPFDGAILSLLRSLPVGLESLLGLITGSGRENGGRRRDEHR